MSEYNFKHLSFGYLGENFEKLTLNSKFYGLLFQKDNYDRIKSDQILLFPQRVPRAEFFSEMALLEVNDFKLTFNQHLSNINNQYTDAYDMLIKHPNDLNLRHCIHWINIMIRHGESDKLMNDMPQVIHSLELELLYETAKIEFNLSKGRSFCINDLLSLYEKYEFYNNTTRREKQLLLNAIIVYFFRFQSHSLHKNKILELGELLEKETNKMKYDDFSSVYYASIMYRGLAMVSSYTKQNIDQKIKLSESLARQLTTMALDNLDRVVAKENLYTCLLTVAKWNLMNNHIDYAEKNFLEMLEIDLFDSTAYSELGLLYFNQNKYDKAEKMFCEAVKLGPPGMGLNAYYYAKLLELRGDIENAIYYLQQACKFDKKGISQHLDLLNYFLDKKEYEKVKEIAQYINSKHILKEQLDQKELNLLSNILTEGQQGEIKCL